MIDTNDHTPKILINSHLSKPLGPSESSSREGTVAMLTEGVAEGSLVAHVSVSDGDSGLNGQFKCQLREMVGSFETSAINFRLLMTSPGDFRLVTTHSNFDREDVSRLVRVVLLLLLLFILSA